MLGAGRKNKTGKDRQKGNKKGGGQDKKGKPSNTQNTHAVATRLRSSGATFFLRGLTGRRCSGEGAEAGDRSM